jgi:mono/diheme cytochrome c family protein
LIVKVTIAGLLLSVSSILLADGKALHDASCLQCHAALTGSGDGNGLYSRADRKVKTLTGLEKRVANCAIAADANWTSVQQQQVIDYLNSRFYRF